MGLSVGLSVYECFVNCVWSDSTLNGMIDEKPKYFTRYAKKKKHKDHVNIN